MMMERKIKSIIGIVPRSLLTILLVFSGCEKFVDVELTNSKIPTDLVFGDDNTANSAMVGLYYSMERNLFITGVRNSLSRLCALSADELYDYSSTDGVVQFEENILTADNLNCQNLWNAGYEIIYQANAIVEGVNSSDHLSDAVRNQLIGESLFLRAFSHFYLMNLFGEIPIITSTDYRSNAMAKRKLIGEIYDQILMDLTAAQELLVEDYISSQRLRPNKAVATAFLARVYLYLEDWQNAEIQASQVISDAQYELPSDFDDVFLKDSREAIWQITPVDALNNTDEASYYVVTGAPNYLVLRNEMANEFETGDKRLTDWVGIYESGGETVYYPHKYKLYPAGTPTQEYSTILRLAEQYLIRAEARAQQNKSAEARQDLDSIRFRAGLPLYADSTGISMPDLVEAILRERQVELFTEWGHRWLDLKRTERALSVLNAIKGDVTSSDLLYPIPQSELNRNPNLGGQNPGY